MGYAERVKQWIPFPGSVKARLVEQAARAFSARGYAGVGVTELARAAGATTGALYHHFGSKLGLYGVVRDGFERRVLDRMEGAAAAVGTGDPRAAVRAALLVGFDATVRLGAARLLGEEDPRGVPCPVTAFLARLLAGEPESLPAVLAAAWRRALQAAEGETAAADARRALEWVLGFGGEPAGLRGPAAGERPA